MAGIGRTLLWLAPWLLWLVATVLAYLRLGGPALLRRTVGRMSAHWLANLFILLLLLLVGGNLGVSLGLPRLFRDDPATGFDRTSPAFWGAFGATLLIGQVWAVIYVTTYIRLYLTQRRPQDEPYTWGSTPRDMERLYSPWSLPKYLAVGAAPTLVALAIVGALPAQRGDGSMARLGGAWYAELPKFVGGISLGAIAVFVLCLVGWGLGAWALSWPWLRRNLLRRSARWMHIQNWRAPLRRELAFESSAAAGVDPDEEVARTVDGIAAAAWGLTGASVLAMAVAMAWPWQLRPSLAIAIVLMLLELIYFWSVNLRESKRAQFVVIALAYLIFVNSDPYKYRFPNMGRIEGRSLYHTGNLLRIKPLEEPGRAVTVGPARPGATLARPLIAGDAVLDAWRREMGPDRPKLVLVAVSGGAYRAGFWTAIVLDELDHGHPGGPPHPQGFSRSVRLITGASGGMVGAAYYVASLHASDAKEPRSDAANWMLRETGRDSLSPVVQRLVQGDLPSLWSPFSPYSRDRGVVLDQQWKALERPFLATYDAEAAGKLPSLVLSPMVVETGFRMLISNLDLSAVADPRQGPQSPYARSAFEFFRLFPSAQPNFRLSTAVRTSATFPLISPAVSLPTVPPRRLVDAGYYDNYGVNLAAAWAYAHREWIRQNTSGLALVQIRAYASTNGTGTDDEGPGTYLTRQLRRAFGWLTAPVEGALAARANSMVFRNNEQLAALDDWFNDDPAIAAGFAPRFFETFVFQHQGGAAMNWIIQEAEIEEMRHDMGIGAAGATHNLNTQELARLRTWWTDQAPAPAMMSPAQYQPPTKN